MKEKTIVSRAKSGYGASPGTNGSGRQSRPNAKGPRQGVLFVLPAMSILVALFVLPLVVTFVVSFLPSDINPSVSELARSATWSQVGFDNYARSFEDSVWLRSIRLTALFAIGTTVVGVGTALLLALALNRIGRGRAIFFALMLIPWAIPPVVNGIMWGLVVHADIGTLNGILKSLGAIERNVIWLGDGTLALLVVTVATSWRYIPILTLLLLASLQGVQPELYEAAAVDGAGPSRQFRHITLPGVRPVLVTSSILMMIWSTKVFDEIWVLTGGGPAFDTTVMNLWIYRQAFDFLRFGYGSALAYLLAGLSAFLLFVYYRQLKRGIA